jgi:hypothetical protein
MKIKTLRLTAILITVFTLSCHEPRQFNSQSASGIPGSATKTPANTSESSMPMQTIDAKYGKLDGKGFPIDPGFAMNSNKMDKEQRLELRQQPPPGYHVGEPMSPRHVIGKADDLAWRNVGAGKFNPGKKEHLAKLLGLNPEHLPPGIFGDYMVLMSPSGRKVIVQSSGSSDSAFLFAAANGVIDVSSAKKVHCINFDDKRRAFIRWESFVGESLIVGCLSDDGDLEDYPIRQILYTYDIDKMMLRCVIFPKDVHAHYGDDFIIDSVAPSAMLLIWDRKQQPMTVYLEQHGRQTSADMRHGHFLVPAQGAVRTGGPGKKMTKTPSNKPGRDTSNGAYPEIRVPMKTLTTTFAIAALTFIGATPMAGARDHCWTPSASSVYVSGYRPCTTPTMTERYLIGYDRWGNPVWGYRVVPARIEYRVPVWLPRIHYAAPACPQRHDRRHNGWRGPVCRR